MGRTGYEGGVGPGSHPATTAATLPASPPPTTAAPSPQDAPLVPEEAGPMDDLPIKQQEVEEPKMDIGEPSHRCVPRV